MGTNPSSTKTKKVIEDAPNNYPTANSQNINVSDKSITQTVQEHEKREVDFKIFVGIDFGTDGCGLAYSFKKDLLNTESQVIHVDNTDDFENEYVEIHTNFKDAGPYEKSRTSVLFDGDGKIQTVGGEAANMYINN
eukprot:132042_1